MEKYFFMKKVLELVAQDRFFKKAFSIALQILALIIALVSLVAWISVWKSVSGYSAEAILGIIIYQLFFVIAVYIVVHTLLIRANDIGMLPESDYRIIPIVSVCLKLTGEVYAGFMAVLSIGGGFLFWFLGGSAEYLINKSIFPVHIFGSGEGFWGGLVFMFGGLFTALFVLVVFYFMGEIVVVMADSARNLKITKEIAEQYDKK
jgi:hypothetical protein